MPLFSFIILCLLIQTPSSFAVSNRETPVVRVVEECAPSVVSIGTEKIVLLKQHPNWGQYGGALDDFFQNALTTQTVSAVKARSIGSGVIVRSDGLIATNAHVVQMANKIYVTLLDGTQWEASIIGVSKEDDLALIKIYPPKKLKSVRLSDSRLIMTGETAVAIGNPYGLENSVSVGIISGKNRALPATGLPRPFTGLLQTDAPINMGNSGGALLNLDGELMGINLALIQQAESIGFAIPSIKIQNMLAEYDRVFQKQNSKSKKIRIPVQ